MDPYGRKCLTGPSDPLSQIRTKQYLGLLILAGILGAPISALAFWFLRLVQLIQGWVFTELPKSLGFHGEPLWWPLLPLVVAGAVTGPTIKYLPGTGGHSPADGFKIGGVARPTELPGIFLAALASLALGVVIGPEAPLVALGGGLAFLAIRLLKRDVPARGGAIVAAAGSFAAVSTLLGSPLAGAFLLLEASALGGVAAAVALLPGLLGAGIGSLIFTGLDSLTGYGTFSLAIPHLPPFVRPNGAEFGWAFVIVPAAGLACRGIRWLALCLREPVARAPVLLTPLAGLAIAALAILFGGVTSRPTSDVLFSGQSALGPLLEHAASFTAGTLLLLLACKGIAYAIALSGFRGGPTFPAMYVGAVGGILLSHLPGLPPIAGAAMGMAAMLVGILRLPMTSVLVTTLFLGAEGIRVMPLVIVAVVGSFVFSAWLSRPPAAAGQAAGGTQPHEPVQVR
jgi:H+/Cl- antiporter ClcA